MIPFNKPYMTGKELWYISDAHHRGQLAGDGFFTEQCHTWLENQSNCDKALLTHSCTAALEMAALLCNLQPGDEIIMPSYTFVSTANAFVLRGAVPVFVDIREDTLNVDEAKIEAAITKKTKAVVPVHYAGVGCEMDTICEIAKEYNLLVIEDAAQGIMSSYKGKMLGTIGDLGCLSFHETKNIISGEGGALLINKPDYIKQAEIIRQKGTNRSSYMRGEIDKYTWQDIGSSYLPGEIIAAFLCAQMEDAELITNKRLSIWDHYHQAFEQLEVKGKVRRPFVPKHCKHNAHMYYLIIDTAANRNLLITTLKEKGIHTVFHYIPLHNSPAGERFCRWSGTMINTELFSEKVLRLPLWPEMTGSDIEQVVEAVEIFYKN